jgi:hypothetical protein
VHRGSKMTYAATVKALGPFSGTVNFRVRGLPALTSASFNPTSVSWVQVKQQYNQRDPDWYLSLNIIGTSGGLKHSTSVKLVIQ